ncbi:MAG: bifunctional DNA-formamidopyrimidine glycosylase/DNA-(apurinic or apyrimidinic site) lyase [Bryobacterales bacterium]|nr:bifunctional DNA-formamidopyrimidine glycosylase/DNA-(apurinic or apyrimidinic site) lyase [Bryobacterales bacterium]
MPELPEVEAVRRRVEREAAGAVIAGVEIQRPGTIAPQTPAAFRKRVTGAGIVSAERRAKHLFIHLANAHSLHIHLRMTGNVYTLPDHRFPPAMARLYFLLQDGRALVFADPRCLGRVHVHLTKEIPSLLPPLGPEPLDPAFTAASLIAIARASRLAVKPFLMDQAQIAGLGNIYAAEVLFQARIHPGHPIGALSTHKLKRLHIAIQNVLSLAIPCCERAYSKPGTFSEADEYPAAVYGREGQPCFRCRKPVARIVQNGRSSYFCPRCQRGVL